tara:strand:+ start:409 stop:747 length:339 start_codon:yes stop_codon:yes gene_type:complete
MRITEKQLRRVIKNTMNEMHHEMVSMPAMHSMPSPNSGHLMMQKAQACMGMDAQKLFMMCTMICSQNPEMCDICKQLCKCVCDGDMEGCCDCLDQICKCSECSNICNICCGC